MEFCERMRASMLIVIMFCMMCVSTVLAREAKIAEAQGNQEGNMYAVCETLYQK